MRHLSVAVLSALFMLGCAGEPKMAAKPAAVAAPDHAFHPATTPYPQMQGNQMAGWWKDRLMSVEMTSGGGRAQLLSNLVAQWPGVIDVYGANTTGRRFARQRAVAAMIAKKPRG